MKRQEQKITITKI